MFFGYLYKIRGENFRKTRKNWFISDVKLS